MRVPTAGIHFQETEKLWEADVPPSKILDIGGAVDTARLQVALERTLEIGDDALAASLLERQEAEGEASGDALALAAAYAYWAGNLESARALAERSLKTEGGYLARFWAGRILALFDPQDSERHLRAAVRLAEAEARWSRVVQASAWLSRVMVLMGRYPEAWSLASWSWRLFRESGFQNLALRLDVVRALGEAGLFSGNVRGLFTPLLKAAQDPARVRSVYRRHVYLRLAELALLGGDLEGAQRLWQAALRGLRSRTALVLSLVPEVRLRLEVGEHPLAQVEATAALAEDLPDALRRYVPLARGMALSGTAPERAVSDLEVALKAFAEPLNAPELARAGLYLMGVFQRLGLYRDAQRVLDAVQGAVAALSEEALRVLAGPETLRPRLERRGLLELSFMGRMQARYQGKKIALSLRQAEILLALAEAGRGLSAQELAERVWPEPVPAVVVRNQMARLRNLVPLLSQPYRFDFPVWADFLEIRDRLQKGEVDAALALYRPPLLPGSQAPVVEELRAVLREEMKRVVIASGDAKRILRLAEREKDDPELWQAAAEAWPEGTVCRALAEGHLRATLEL